jgi:hypothetical protein
MSTLNEHLTQIRDTQRNSLANAIVEQHYTQQAELAERYGEKGRIKCLADTHYHLTYLNPKIRYTQA